jgi:hypothetical protein
MYSQRLGPEVWLEEVSLGLIAKRFAGIEAQQAEMTAVDRLGFHMRLTTRDGMKGTRIAFCAGSDRYSANQKRYSSKW